MKAAIALILLLSCLNAAAEYRLRPAEWATPVIGSELENMYKVDEGLYRSEQPDDDDFEALERYGIREVLNLREYHSDEDDAGDTSLRLHRIRIETDEITERQLAQALAIIDASEGPILVHCWHGSDRTGAVIAAYRVARQGWSREKAIDELAHGGYGYHSSFYPNIVDLIRTMDLGVIDAEVSRLSSQ